MPRSIIGILIFAEGFLFNIAPIWNWLTCIWRQRFGERVEPDFFDIASDNEVPTQPMTIHTPDQVPEPIQPMEVEREKVTQIPVQIPQIAKKT